MRLAAVVFLALTPALFAQNVPMAAGTDHAKPPVPRSHSVNVDESYDARP